MSASDLPIIPSWRADETLFSWVAIFHRIQGGSSAKRTSLSLFDISHGPRLIDVPTRLKHFCDRTKGRLGTPQQILKERTLLHYFARFSPAREMEEALSSATFGDSGSAVTRMGLKLRGVVRRQHLKACPDCVKEARENFGMPIWRRVHQLPLAHLCLRHQRELHVWDGSRSVWLLPDDQPARFVIDIKSSATEEAAALLSEVEEILLGHRVRCDAATFRRRTIEALGRLGVIKPHLRVDASKVSAWLNASSVWHTVCGGGLAPGDVDVGGIAELLLTNRRKAHPALWSLIWTAMAGIDGDAMSWLVAALDGNGLTPEQIDLDLDVSPQSDLPGNLESVLMSCETLAEAALKFNVSVHTLRRWLERSGPLRLTWARSREAARQCKAVGAIRSYIEANPWATRTEVLASCKTEVAWLQIHDREKLQQALSSIPPRKHPQRSLFQTFEA